MRHIHTNKEDSAKFAWHEIVNNEMSIIIFWAQTYFIFFRCCSFETPERSVYDDSGLNYSDHANNHTECTDLGNGNSGSGCSSGSGGIGSNSASCLHLKAEPMGGPSTPESTSELQIGPDDCAGCGRLIQVRTVIRHFFMISKVVMPFNCLWTIYQFSKISLF